MINYESSGIKVSVIIPVYNSEKFLESCISSLKEQKLKDIEFIFINDGSIDNSKKIIEQFKEQDDRTILINQKNKGPSNARNIGIDNARGEYLAFVDSDDFIEKNMLFELYKQAKLNNSDIAICDMKINIDNKSYTKRLNFPSYCPLNDKKEIYKILLESDLLNSLGNKLYRKSIIYLNKIRLNNRIDYGEDLLFNLDFFKWCDSYVYINKSFYNYRKGHISLTSKYDSLLFERNGINLYKIRKEYGENLLNDSFLGSYKLFETSIYCLINEFRKFNRIHLKIKKENANNIIKNTYLIEGLNHLNKKKLSLKEKIFYFSIKNRLILNFRIIAFFIDYKYELKERYVK